jgi:lipoprotein NlpD
LVAVLVAGGCSHGIYHRVRRGETLYRIGKAYGVSVQRLARANRLPDPSRIEVGQRLFIPGAGREVPVDVVTPSDVSAKVPRHDEAPPPGRPRPFIWPVASGSLTSGFGPRGHSFHDGIDIAAPLGTAVVAAADGEVIYSDFLPGYGNVIILRHGDGYATVYAHNRQNQVREGTHVRRGQQIATVGDSGRTTGPNLHFEVRRENIARNPLYFLPPIMVTGAGGR